MSLEFDALCDTIHRLRAPDGCPWDRKQTPQTLRSCLIEECFETINAIDAADTANIREELGDILLNVAMLCEIYNESGSFSVADVLNEVNEKLIRRHPHVFGDLKAENAEEALAGWNVAKQKEKSTPTSLLDSVPLAYPPLLKAWKMQQKAAKVGFDWDCAAGAEKKVTEEFSEIKEAVEAGDFEGIEEECGDLLFAVVNWCRRLGVHPVTALNKANLKFDRRFRYVEKRCGLLSGEKQPTLEEMDAAWDEAKMTEEAEKME